jgi:putative DNA primase/helicase
VADQIDDLEEVASMMLDPSRTPSKAVFLFGPSRSGKSTFLRLLQALVGQEATARRHHPAPAQSRVGSPRPTSSARCSTAPPTSQSAHVDDISIFKMMTGEDPIQADRKYGKPVRLHQPGAVRLLGQRAADGRGGSRAYTERIKPFEFPVSFAGREDPEIEDADAGRGLPGILVRWVRAWQRRHAAAGRTCRPTRGVQKEFETALRPGAPVARRAVLDVARRRPTGSRSGTARPSTDRASTKAELAKAFNEWAERTTARRWASARSSTA